MSETQNSNALVIYGKVSKKELSHEYMEEKFFKMSLDVPRQSGAIDTLPVIVSEKLLFNNEVEEGQYIRVEGQLRTRNEKSSVRNKLVVFGYALEVIKITEEEFLAQEDKNVVKVSGFIVKKPCVRETKKGRKIADTIIACNRQHNRSDYIPCIIWGKEAGFARNLETSNKVAICGRLQSREYPTRGENGEQVMRTAYELSVQKISVDAE